MSGPAVAETSRGHVEIEFGVNRWVLVTIASEAGQEQLSSSRELRNYLRRRGLTDREAEEVARNAWRSRPSDAGLSAPDADEGLLAATGLSSSKALLLVIAFAVIVTLIALYAISRWPET